MPYFWIILQSQWIWFTNPVWLIHTMIWFSPVQQFNDRTATVNSQVEWMIANESFLSQRCLKWPLLCFFYILFFFFEDWKPQFPLTFIIVKKDSEKIIPKFIFSAIQKKKKSHRFGKTWEWHNFGWIIPLHTTNSFKAIKR